MYAEHTLYPNQVSANFLHEETDSEYLLGHMVFAATSRLCCSVKAAIMNEYGHVLIKLYL